MFLKIPSLRSRIDLPFAHFHIKTVFIRYYVDLTVPSKQTMNLSQCNVRLDCFAEFQYLHRSVALKHCFILTLVVVVRVNSCHLFQFTLRNFD